uniref:JmjC domain-containing protein n=1 Tax=Dunaliella tertiolecta TaxID=3047 RepID=A0A7S3VMN3_DUNTE
MTGGKAKRPPVWTDTVEELNWPSGLPHDLASQGFIASQAFSSPGAAGAKSRKSSCSSSKRTRRAWQDKPRSFQSLYTEYQDRVEACWEESAAIRACKAQADALYTAMVETPIQDARLSVAGEQARIMARALAMKDVLVQQDPTVADMLGLVEVPAEEVQGPWNQGHTTTHSTTHVPPPASPAAAAPAAGAEGTAQAGAAAVQPSCSGDGCRAPSPPAAANTRSSTGRLGSTSPSKSCSPQQQEQQQQQQQRPRQRVYIQRSSNEDDPDANTEECLLSVCLLLAALYEQTPFGDTELRRRLFDDFTQLKRHFRNDDLPVLHGRTGSIKELFDSIKDLDKHSGLQNLLGIVFEDWKVNKRVDSFILAEQIIVQVTSLTPQGPIGKFACKMRTFSALSLLHQQLLKELYLGMFAHKNPPRGQHEMMTVKDPLDFVDFVEAMARNMPYQRMTRPGGGHVYYAWMYAPEANATTETWEEIFGEKESAVPALHDGVKMPQGLQVHHLDEDGDYSLDLEAITRHDMREEGLSQTPVAFPWADDLLGEFLRRIRRERQKLQPCPKQEPQDPCPKQEAWQSQPSQAAQPVLKQEQQQPCDGAQLQGTQYHEVAAASTKGGWYSTSYSSCVKEEIKQETDQGCGCRGSGGSSSSSLQGQGTVGACEGIQSKSFSQHGCHHFGKGAGPAPPSLEAQGNGNGYNSRPPPIANAEKTGRLVLPLGIFLVGIICSGAHTNTQIHVEDLLLMSININMFGSPKVWWWVPQESVQEFKNYAESMTEGGRKELYTKSISPFLQDREENPPQPTLPLDRLRAMGVRRTIQMPGMGVLTMPGYAFHFTVSQGLNLAESCNMFLEVMGWTFEKLWKARPLEQYPNEVDDMARYMRDTGVLSRLGIPDVPPDNPKRVHRSLKQHNLGSGKVVNSDGTKLQRYVTPDLVKYVSLPSKEKQEEEYKRLIRQRQEQQQPIIVII